MISLKQGRESTNSWLKTLMMMITTRLDTPLISLTLKRLWKERAVLKIELILWLTRSTYKQHMCLCIMISNFSTNARKYQKRYRTSWTTLKPLTMMKKGRDRWNKLSYRSFKRTKFIYLNASVLKLTGDWTRLLSSCRTMNLMRLLSTLIFYSMTLKQSLVICCRKKSSQKLKAKRIGSLIWSRNRLSNTKTDRSSNTRHILWMTWLLSLGVWKMLLWIISYTT